MTKTSINTRNGMVSEVNTDFEQDFQTHLKFVNSVLNEVIRKHGYVISQNDKEDIIQTTLIVLVELYREFDRSLLVPFYAYAKKRVYGSIVDYFRKNSQIPRRQQEFYGKYQSLKNNNSKLGKTTQLKDAAKFMDIDVDKLAIMLLNWESRHACSIDDALENPQSEKNYPYFYSQKESEHKVLEKALSTLSKDERKILTLYFDDELSLSKIGNHINLSDARVSQIKKIAINKLRNYLI